MEIEEKNTPGVGNPTDADNGGTKGEATKPKGGEEVEKEQDHKEGKTFTQEDLDRIISERLKKENERMQKRIKEEVEKARAEAERLAKLSAEEKEAELKKQREKELQEKERELTLRENKLAGINKLNELGMPISLVDYVVDVDASVMEEKITKLHNEWTNAVKEGIKQALAGKEAPKDPSAGKDRSSVDIGEVAYL